MIIPLLAWLAFIGCAVGSVYAVKKKRACWVAWLISNILWLSYAYLTKQWPLAFQEFIFIMLNIWGIVQWK